MQRAVLGNRIFIPKKDLVDNRGQLLRVRFAHLLNQLRIATVELTSKGAGRSFLASIEGAIAIPDWSEIHNFRVGLHVEIAGAIEVITITDKILSKTRGDKRALIK